MKNNIYTIIVPCMLFYALISTHSRAQTTVQLNTDDLKKILATNNHSIDKTGTVRNNVIVAMAAAAFAGLTSCIAVNIFTYSVIETVGNHITFDQLRVAAIANFVPISVIFFGEICAGIALTANRENKENAEKLRVFLENLCSKANNNTACVNP